jgi:hypothetical protein
VRSAQLAVWWNAPNRGHAQLLACSDIPEHIGDGGGNAQKREKQQQWLNQPVGVDVPLNVSWRERVLYIGLVAGSAHQASCAAPPRSFNLPSVVRRAKNSYLFGSNGCNFRKSA